MMTRTFAALALAVTMAAPTAAIAAPSITALSTQRAINTAVEKDRATYGGRTPVPGVLVAVWDKAGHSYIHGFGYADMRTKRALTMADHFRIGSNTKTFTVAAILQLVDEGKLRLDDPVSKFDIGVKVPNGKNITVRELCDMRSGIFEAYQTPQMNAYQPSRDKMPDARTIIRWALAQKPYFAPGKGYHYTNTGYLMLGLIVEAVTHDTFAHQIETRFLRPYHLLQTSIPTTIAMPEPYARGYELDAKGDWVNPEEVPVQVTGPAGDMISDANDIHRWIMAYVTGKVSAPATYHAMMNCLPIDNAGLAFGLGLACTNGWFGYTGGLPGYNTADYYNPKTGLFVLAWVDLQRAEPSPGVANAIVRDIGRVLTPDAVPFAGTEKTI